ncbi:bifunctional DNA-directed DNA polymerase [Babesia duncani]|uniref:DNA polymerase n=1 Tax=Babesia duncani TaxID=323732 RepID=A0AAD9UMQ8_9APIC|nr:bifunctional DNA-directed DNA polymerase [Babesia duncani]
MDSLNLLIRIQALPLTRELTCIAGNTWSRSIQCARSERNDFMLLHEFHKAKFILDHNFERRQPARVQDDSQDDAQEEKGKRKKKGYEGGLVFEPEAGFYETFILLLDFNSLYPSIIQEFNICFTTSAILKQEQNEDEVIEEIITETPGMLPQILKRLVQLRASVKKSLVSERNPIRKAQLSVRQLALKLAANSLYGCLGSVYSRFHARHLAAYITKQGRMVLQATRDKVHQNFNFKVIYGDTDSLMIDTHIRDDGQLTSYEAAKQIAHTLQTTINKSHSKLEMGIDAIFNRMLLLKKKKYAALKVVDYANGEFAREIKGLDFIRRDWSVLTKQVGNAILGIILGTTSGGTSVEGTVEQIHDTLRSVNAKIAQGEFPPKVWEITRQLARNPSEYSDVNNLPHVAVALRLNESGAATFSAGHEVSFVICSKESIAQASTGDSGVCKSLSTRAFSLTEMLEKGLSPDVEYYKTQQLLPPILRLCSVIRGTDPQKLARCLEVENTINPAILSSDYGNFDLEEHECKALALVKRTSARYREVRWKISDNVQVEFATGVACQFCNEVVLASAFLRGCFCIRICNICNTTTLQVVPGALDACPQPTCQSPDAMQQLLPASKIYLYYDHLTFLLEGDLEFSKDDTQQQQPPNEALVKVHIDQAGRVSIAPTDSMDQNEPVTVESYGDIMENVSKASSLKCTSGFKACAKYILALLECIPHFKSYTLDYSRERQLLYQAVSKLQERNAYGCVDLAYIFKVFHPFGTPTDAL